MILTISVTIYTVELYQYDLICDNCSSNLNNCIKKEYVTIILMNSKTHIKPTVNINVLVTEKKLHPVNANSSDVTCVKNLATYN